MGILEDLAESKERAKKADITNQGVNGSGEMSAAVFTTALQSMGVDAESIEDCLFEPTEKWEEWIQYFQGKTGIMAAPF